MPHSPPRETQRIAKLLARAGVASRRDVERMIEAGRIAVDGVVVATPATLLPSLRGVTVDGNPVAAASPTRLFLFHKPAGVLTAARDPGGRPTIYDRLPDDLPRVMPVGRLDLATEGLLLLTTDGEFKRQLELPATGVERSYRARAYGNVEQAALEELMMGVEIDGVRYAPINANLERRTGANVWIEMTLTEGKNREVRRVLEHLGLRVSRLIRTRYGPFVLGDLPEGEVGEVRQHELVAFRQSLKGRPTSRPRPEGADPAALRQWRRDPAQSRPVMRAQDDGRPARDAGSARPPGDRRAPYGRDRTQRTDSNGPRERSFDRADAGIARAGRAAPRREEGAGAARFERGRPADRSSTRHRPASDGADRSRYLDSREGRAAPTRPERSAARGGDNHPTRFGDDRPQNARARRAAAFARDNLRDRADASDGDRSKPTRAKPRGSHPQSQNRDDARAHRADRSLPVDHGQHRSRPPRNEGRPPRDDRPTSTDRPKRPSRGDGPARPPRPPRGCR